LARVSTPKIVGLLHEVPAATALELATEKPLSIATRLFVTFSSPPTSAWYVVEVTTIDVADTATIKRASTILPERYQVNVLRSRLPSLDALFMLAPLLSRFRTRLSVRYLRLAHVGNNSDQRMRIVEAIRIGVRFPKLPLIRREMLHALPPTLFLTSRFPIWHR